MAARQEKKQEPRRWRKFEDQPAAFYDWPARDWDDDAPRYLERVGDPIIVWQSWNGYDVWYGPDRKPPPAEWWICMPKRPKESA